MGKNTAFDKVLFYQNLCPFFEEMGYRWIPGRQQFRKSNEYGFQNITISPLVKGDGVYFDVQFGTRFDIVERTVQPFIHSPSDYAIDSNTALIKLNQFIHPDELSLSAHSEMEVASVVNGLKKFFDINGFEYLERLNDVAYVERMFNRHPNIPTKLSVNPVYRCYRGITLARMVENPRWNDVHKAYLHQMELNKTPSHLLHSYLQLIEYLNGFGLN